MIIRSQDKTMITNFRKVTDLFINSNRYNTEFEITACLPYSIIDDCATSILGTYSTEEKAIKVLDMITQQYASYSCRYGSDCSHYAVFQMPSDEEVEV